MTLSSESGHYSNLLFISIFISCRATLVNIRADFISCVDSVYFRTAFVFSRGRWDSPHVALERPSALVAPRAKVLY